MLTTVLSIISQLKVPAPMATAAPTKPPTAQQQQVSGLRFGSWRGGFRYILLCAPSGYGSGIRANQQASNNCLSNA